MSIGIIASSRIIIEATFFDVNPKLFNTDNTSKTLQVLVEAQGDWTVSVSTEDNWISGNNSGSGNTNLGIFVNVNNGFQRSATVTFTETSSSNSVDVTINQEQGDTETPGGGGD
jgi:hypothetical protein